MKPYKNRKDLQNRNNYLYRVLSSRRPDILDKYLPSNRIRRAKDSCKESALKYETRSEWAAGDENSYNAARRHDWIDECCKHMELVRKTHSLDTCKMSAKKYKTRKEWKIGDPCDYYGAQRRGWIDECCKNMKENAHKKPVFCVETGEWFPSGAAASRQMGVRIGAVSSSMRSGHKVKGLTFKFVE